jgi:hypothetical protein
VLRELDRAEPLKAAARPKDLSGGIRYLADSGASYWPESSPQLSNYGLIEGARRRGAPFEH